MSWTKLTETSDTWNKLTESSDTWFSINRSVNFDDGIINFDELTISFDGERLVDSWTTI